MHCRSKCPTIYVEDFPREMPFGFELSGLFLCDTGGLYYDWDGDRIPNWWEARYSPVGDKMSMLANDDSDGDGASNFAEFVAYTDPTNVLSRFIVEIAHAADSAATIEALKRPSAAEPAKAGDAVVAPKQEGAQGFYKVWVSDAPIEAE